MTGPAANNEGAGALTLTPLPSFDKLRMRGRGAARLRLKCPRSRRRRRCSPRSRTSDEVKAETARRERRVKLQTAYGQAVTWAKGFAAEETRAAYARAAELVQQGGSEDDRFQVLYAEVTRAFTRNELVAARKLGESLLREAQAKGRAMEIAARPTRARLHVFLPGRIRDVARSSRMGSAATLARAGQEVGASFRCVDGHRRDALSFPDRLGAGRGRGCAPAHRPGGSRRSGFAVRGDAHLRSLSCDLPRGLPGRSGRSPARRRRNARIPPGIQHGGLSGACAALSGLGARPARRARGGTAGASGGAARLFRHRQPVGRPLLLRPCRRARGAGRAPRNRDRDDRNRACERPGTRAPAGPTHFSIATRAKSCSSAIRPIPRLRRRRFEPRSTSRASKARAASPFGRRCRSPSSTNRPAAPSKPTPSSATPSKGFRRRPRCPRSSRRRRCSAV